MKGKQVQRFAAQYLLPHLDRFRADGRLIYRIPVGNVLRGFLFESSGFSAEAFYPQVFVQPLYVPADYLVLDLGKRFLGSWEFLPGQERQLGQKLLYQIFETGLPFLSRHEGAEGIVKEIRKNPALRVNSRLRETLVYSLLILGRNDEGLDELDKLLAMLEPTSDAREWERDLHAEIGTLREQLMRSPSELRATLQAWGEQTKQNLRLSDS